MRRAKTPYQRVLDSEQVNPAVKEKLMSIYYSLDPVKCGNRFKLHEPES